MRQPTKKHNSLFSARYRPSLLSSIEGAGVRSETRAAFAFTTHHSLHSAEIFWQITPRSNILPGFFGKSHLVQTFCRDFLANHTSFKHSAGIFWQITPRSNILPGFFGKPPLAQTFCRDYLANHTSFKHSPEILGQTTPRTINNNK